MNSQAQGVAKVKLPSEMTDDELEKAYIAETSIGRKGELNQERTRRKSAAPKPTPPPPTGTGSSSSTVAIPRSLQPMLTQHGVVRGFKPRESEVGRVYESNATASDVAAPGVLEAKRATQRETLKAKYRAMTDAEIQFAKLNAPDAGERAIIAEVMAERDKAKNK